MSRQDANAAFARTSFLYGSNAAYIEDLYAKYETNPAAVDAAWQEFFKALKDDPGAVAKNAQGASWRKPNWPLRPNGDLVCYHLGTGDGLRDRLGLRLVRLTRRGASQRYHSFITVLADANILEAGLVQRLADVVRNIRRLGGCIRAGVQAAQNEKGNEETQQLLRFHFLFSLRNT